MKLFDIYRLLCKPSIWKIALTGNYNWIKSSASERIQSVPTALSSENFIFPFGIRPSFCRLANFSETESLCFLQVTPTMYSSVDSATDITNSGGFTQSFPFSLTEHRFGIVIQNLFEYDIKLR